MIVTSWPVTSMCFSKVSKPIRARPHPGSITPLPAVWTMATSQSGSESEFSASFCSLARRRNFSALMSSSSGFASQAARISSISCARKDQAWIKCEMQDGEWVGRGHTCFGAPLNPSCPAAAYCSGHRCSCHQQQKTQLIHGDPRNPAPAFARRRIQINRTPVETFDRLFGVPGRTRLTNMRCARRDVNRTQLRCQHRYQH